VLIATSFSDLIAVLPEQWFRRPVADQRESVLFWISVIRHSDLFRISDLFRWETSMTTRILLFALLITTSVPISAAAQMTAAGSDRYRAIRVPVPPPSGTWAILDRDGARRKVEPYLSSLGGGESGTGVITSPPFRLSVDKIIFTICGHDGHGGGGNENYITLVDDNLDTTLTKTMAPGCDPMQEHSWDVAKFKGYKVRVEVHDGDARGAYAWLGIGKIDAGPSFTLDFREGLPKDWKVTSKSRKKQAESVEGGIPFRRVPAVYTMVPLTGIAEIPFGLDAEHLFFLGCTVQGGKPLETYGTIEILYRSGRTERYPLMFGFTLDAQDKLPSRSKALYLHASGDLFQHYLVIRPARERIQKIRLERNPDHDAIPRITAITCETDTSGESLIGTPFYRPDAEEEAWIRSHSLSADYPNMEKIKAEIRQAHKM